MTTTVISSGHSGGFSITHGNELIVESGGVSTRSVIGGTEIVSSGGSAVGDYIQDHGSATIFGSASDTIVKLGGTLIISAGGSLRSAVESGNIGVEGGRAYSTIVEDANLIVGGGGVAFATVLRGGDLELDDGGSAVGVVDPNGLDVTVFDGGLISSATFSDGGLLVNSGGLARYIIDDYTKITIDGTLDSGFIRSTASAVVGGFGNDIRVSGGGEEDVERGGSLSGGYLLSGAYGQIASGASITGVTMSSGAQLYDEPGGIAVDMILHPGAELVFQRGSATATISNGVLDIFNADGDLAQSITLAEGGGGLGVSRISGNANGTEFEITKVIDGGAAMPVGRVAMFAQSLAGFGVSGALAGSAIHPAAHSSVGELLRPK